MVETMITPHLQIAADGPLQQLEEKIISHQVQIETWFRSQWQQFTPSFYCSVDLRNAGFKLAPIDTNLFPAGFNNLNPDFLPLCVQAAQSYIEHVMPGCNRILLIPESHSRNLFYLSNVAQIKKILATAGFDVRLGSVNGSQTDNSIDLPDGESLTLEPVIKKGNRVYCNDFSPCLILLNHDLSEGIPDSLQDIEQKIIPSLNLGWANRLKSEHFKHYQQVAEEFAKLIDIDPWLINPIYRRCDEVDFMARGGEQCLAKHVEDLIAEVKTKYTEYGINREPFIVVKADAGTYGMGVMMVDDPKQIYDLNRKQRKKMAVSKGGKQVNKVIIQEGVYTFETIGPENNVAEPVIYMIGHQVVGGFYRVHQNKSASENLNSPGMTFEPLAFAESCNVPDTCASEPCFKNRFYTYGVIARLALLAAARES